MSAAGGPGSQRKVRLDQLLVDRGLVESREQGCRLIMAGAVKAGDSRNLKAGAKVAADLPVAIEAAEKYVSRGGLKLEAALAEFGVDPAGLVCLDLGASTGGFPDCLLQHGADQVYAFDVGHNQLHWRIRQHPRVVAREGFNIRHIVAADLPEDTPLVVADLSFISLTLILPPVFALLPPKADMSVLVNPHFELARNEVPRGGVVRDAALHRKAVERIRTFALSSLQAEWRGCMSSPIPGTKGNLEFLAHLRKP